MSDNTYSDSARLLPGSVTQPFHRHFDCAHCRLPIRVRWFTEYGYPEGDDWEYADCPNCGKPLRFRSRTVYDVEPFEHVKPAE